jgi:hypothetical protein
LQNGRDRRGFPQQLEIEPLNHRKGDFPMDDFATKSGACSRPIDLGDGRSGSLV